MRLFEVDIIFSSNTCLCINSLPASGKFHCLLMIFANSLDPDQDGQKIGPDLDPNHLTLIVLLKDIFE